MATPRPHHPYPAITTVLPATSILVVRRRPSITDCPVPYRLSKRYLLCASFTEIMGKARIPSAAMDFNRFTPEVVSSEPPRMPGRRCFISVWTVATRSAPSSTIMFGPTSSVDRTFSKYSSTVIPCRLNTATPFSTRAAQTSSWVESGLLPAAVTTAPSSFSRISRQAVFASRWRHAEITVPFRGRAAPYLFSRKRSTGMYCLAQRIFFSPEGASPRSAIRYSIQISSFQGRRRWQARKAAAALPFP